MTELLTAAQMRAIEQAAIDSGEVTGLELMERAGRGVVEAIFEEWPELAKTSHRAVVLCGPGNNGGDGFVVARLLKEWGWEVEVFLYGDPDKLPPDAKVNYERWGGLGEVQAAPYHFRRDADLYIDAVFGTGLARPVKGEMADTLAHFFHVADRLVSIDVPSGYCADSGQQMGPETDGTVCVTFTAPRVGHHMADCAAVSTNVYVADIGVGPAGPHGSASSIVRQVMRPDGEFLGKLNAAGLHKYTHGHALILSGPSGKGGAARLAARGALRIGAGLVTVGCPADATVENAAQLNAIMLRSIDGAGDLAEALTDDRLTALALGPGLGLDARAKGLVAAALGVETPDQVRGGPAQRAPAAAPGPRPAGSIARSLVLDADALTLIAANPDLMAALHANCVITPHAGEFARLFPDITEKLNAPATKGPAYSKVDATREAATRAGCIVLFKGPDTVIAAPDGRCSINSAHYDRAAPWLATAGSGDVLTGFIAGLLARGFSPLQAAETAAWLHVECALKFGPGLIAEDLPEQLPAVFRDLGL